MHSEETILELVELIYRAAGDPAAWSAVLERLVAVLGGNVGTIHHQDNSLQESSFSTLWNVGPESTVPYTAYYGRLNPLMSTRPRLIRAGAVNTLEMLCPKEAYVESEYYVDYMRDYDVLDCVGATLHCDREVSSNLTIFRPPRSASFGEEERKFLLVLMPHLQRAFQLHNQIQGLERQGGAVAAALDHLPQGVVLLDGKERLLLVNHAAMALFAREKALRLTPTGLVAAIPSENRQLNTLIKGAISMGNGKGLHPGGAVGISRGDFRRPLQVLVTPLRTRTIHLGKVVPVAAIFISDPDAKPISDTAALNQLFGFTPAEARLALALAAGKSLKEVSEELSVTQSTVRSQLKSVFAKTNTNRQSALVRLLLLLIPLRGNATESE